MSPELIIIVLIIIVLVAAYAYLFNAILKIVSAIVDGTDNESSTMSFIITAMIIIWAPYLAIFMILFEEEIVDRFANS